MMSDVNLIINIVAVLMMLGVMCVQGYMVGNLLTCKAFEWYEYI